MTKKALAITSYNHNTIFFPLIFKFGKNSAAVILNVIGKFKKRSCDQTQLKKLTLTLLDSHSRLTNQK